MRLSYFAAPLVVVLATAPPVRADDAHAPGAPTQERARDVYAQGVKLHKQGDHLRAAQAFAHADEIAPTPVALRAALDESLLAGDPLLAMTLAERAARAPNDAALRDRVVSVRARFADKAGRVTISCPASAHCLATIDGASTAVGTHWVAVGQHTIVAQLGEESQQRLVDVRAGETVDAAFRPKPVVAPAVPPPSSPTAQLATTERKEAAAPVKEEAIPTSKGGVSPAIFFVGAAVTTAAGAATILSGIDTRTQRDDFVKRQCNTFAGPDCSELSTRGTNARTRTNIFAAGTGVVGVATVVIGVFLVRWSEPKPTTRRGRDPRVQRVTARIVPSLDGASVEGSF